MSYQWFFAVAGALILTPASYAIVPLDAGEMATIRGFACSCGSETNNCENENDECDLCHSVGVGEDDPACPANGWDYVGATIDGCHCGGSQEDHYCPSGTQTCASKVTCSSGTVAANKNCDEMGDCVSVVGPFKCLECSNGSSVNPAQTSSVSNRDCTSPCT